MNPAKVIAMMRGAALGGTTTWDPSNKGSGVTLSSGDRVMTVAGGTPNSVRSTTSKADDSGKWYAEVVAGSGSNLRIGFCNTGASMSGNLGADNSGVGYDVSGDLYVGNGVVGTLASYSMGDVVGLAVDTAAQRLWFAKNGVWQNGDPVAGTNGLIYGTGPEFVAAGASGGARCVINTGQDPFRATVPTGFTHWG